MSRNLGFLFKRQVLLFNKVEIMQLIVHHDNVFHLAKASAFLGPGTKMHVTCHILGFHH